MDLSFADTEMQIVRREDEQGHVEVDLPYKFNARPYQSPLWTAMVENDVKRAVAIWHRRAGKDKVYFQIAVAMTQQRVGSYWYMLPKTSQARRVIWQGRGKENVIDGEVGGVAFLEHIPAPLIRKINSSEMYIEFWNGSILYVLGSDNYNSYVGSNPLGVVFSEWSLCDPMSWEFIRPILAENDGWAMFCYTPRGRNHGFSTYKTAKRNEKRWFVSLLTVEDTIGVDGERIITEEMVEQEREDGMSDDMIEQEFYCSFDASQPGVIFAKEMKRVRAENRITSIPIEPMIPVHTFWDWGIADDTSVWLCQIIGKERRLVGFYSNNGEKLEHYLSWLTEFQKNHDGMIYGDHVGPHDTNTRNLQTGMTNAQVAAGLGYDFEWIDRVANKDISINALRRIFSTLWFDQDRCDLGISAAETYHYEHNEKTKVLSTKPKHDWSSNPMDALQQLALKITAIEASIEAQKKDQETVVMGRFAHRGGSGWQGG